GSEQSCHPLVEWREADLEVVAAELQRDHFLGELAAALRDHRIQRRHRILCGSRSRAARACDEDQSTHQAYLHLVSSPAAARIAVASSVIPSPRSADTTWIWSASRPSSRVRSRSAVVTPDRLSLSALVSTTRTAMPDLASNCWNSTSSLDGGCLMSSSHTTPLSVGRSRSRRSSSLR